LAYEFDKIEMAIISLSMEQFEKDIEINGQPWRLSGQLSQRWLKICISDALFTCWYSYSTHFIPSSPLCKEDIFGLLKADNAPNVAIKYLMEDEYLTISIDWKIYAGSTYITTLEVSYDDLRRAKRYPISAINRLNLAIGPKMANIAAIERPILDIGARIEKINATLARVELAKEKLRRLQIWLGPIVPLALANGFVTSQLITKSAS
jgi:hypothetical protein